MGNFVVILLAALVPLVLGAIWYNPKLFGNAWMKVAEMTDEKIKSGNMAMIFIVTYILSVLLAFMLYPVVVHQAHIGSLFMGEEGFMTGEGAAFEQFTALMEQFQGSFRSFKHGALHGTIAGIFIGLPVIGVLSLFERKGFKYIAIHAGYWIITMALMGGIICQWA